MQPTVSPWAWVSSWDRRARSRAAGEFARSRDRAAPRAREHDKYAFYGLRKDSRHFIRNIPTIIDDDVPSRLDPLAKGLLLNRQWAPTSAPVTWRVDRYHNTEPWAVPDIKSVQSYRPYEPASIVHPGEQAPVLSLGPAGAPRTMGPLTHGWSHGAIGWVLGALVLAVLVLLVRAAENCLQKRLFRAIYAHSNVGAGELQQSETRPGQYRLPGVRRQESDEWSTPNVMATILHREDSSSSTDLDDIEDFPDAVHRTSDMPPPYSECARPSVTGIADINDINKHVGEEPPPPYSACSVSYNNPKDGEPQVHIRLQNDLIERAHSSTDIDNVQNDLIENGPRADSFAMATISNDSQDDPSGIRTQLIFANGRIVERLSLDLNSNNSEAEVASNDNIEEQSTRHADCKDRVVFIDETASENTSPDTALFV